MNDFDFSDLKKELSSKPNILITSHRGPDGDALGSCLALYQIFKILGYQVRIVVPNAYPDFLHWLPFNDEVVEYESNTIIAQKEIDRSDLIFCLDFNDLRRTDMMQNALSDSHAKFVMIDHHQDPSDFAHYTYSVPTVSSTAQLVYEFIEVMGWMKYMTVDVAKCIYTGIVTDTGSFRFSSVDSKTHEIASHFMKLGIDQASIHQKLFDNNNPNRLKLLGYCLSDKMELIPDLHTAIISLSSEELENFFYEKGDTEGFVNYPLSIKNITFAAFFVQFGDIVKISFRSQNQFRANDFSKRHFSGGGHINAAGGVFYGSVNDAILKFKQVLPDFKEELLSNC